MKKKISGYVIRTELTVGCLHRAVMAALLPVWFCAAKLDGFPSAILGIVCGLISVGIIVECIVRAGKLSEPEVKASDETAKQEQKKKKAETEMVSIPEEYYATFGKKPANRGRKGRK